MYKGDFNCFFPNENVVIFANLKKSKTQMPEIWLISQIFITHYGYRQKN